MDAAELVAIPLLAGMTLDQRASIAQVCEALDVQDGAALVEEGDFSVAAFAIASGTADVVNVAGALRATIDERLDTSATSH